VVYGPLARCLAPDRPVVGLVDAINAAPRPVDELADEIAATIRRLRPDGPYHLGGYSSGATVAIAVAQRLQAQGAAVGLVAILDHANPTSGYHVSLPWRPSRFAPFLINLIRWVRHPANRDAGRLIRAVPRKIRYFAKALLRRLGRFGVPIPRFGLADFMDPTYFADVHWERMDVALAARLGYVPAPYSGSLTVFQAEIRPVLCSFDPYLGWSDVAMGGLDVHVVPGDHYSFLHEPQVRVLADQLRESLSLVE
jgi:thioesterase domain-containing protein